MPRLQRSEAPYDFRCVSQAKRLLRAVLPPFIASGARRVLRRLPGHGLAFSWPDVPLSDGVVKLRLIDGRDLGTIERAAHDTGISGRFPLLKARPRAYFEHYRHASRDRGAAAFAICDMGGECFGLVTIDVRDLHRLELGYWLLPAGRGQGRATRALRLVSRWALSQPSVARLEIGASTQNTASQRVAERSGFRREGTFRAYYGVDDGHEDMVFFSLLQRDLDEVDVRADGTVPVDRYPGDSAGEAG